MSVRPRRNPLPLHIRRNERLTFAAATPTHPDVAISDPCFHDQRIALLLDIVKYLEWYRIELIERSGS
jgi:hypothetical protein